MNKDMNMCNDSKENKGTKGKTDITVINKDIRSFMGDIFEACKCRGMKAVLSFLISASLLTVCIAACGRSDGGNSTRNTKATPSASKASGAVVSHLSASAASGASSSAAAGKSGPALSSASGLSGLQPALSTGYATDVVTYMGLVGADTIEVRVAGAQPEGQVAVRKYRLSADVRDEFYDSNIKGGDPLTIRYLTDQATGDRIICDFIRIEPSLARADTAKIPVYVEGTIEYRDARLFYSADMSYSLYVLNYFTYASEEPGRDVVMANYDGEFFVRIEKLGRQTDNAEASENSKSSEVPAASAGSDAPAPQVSSAASESPGAAEVTDTTEVSAGTEVSDATEVSVSDATEVSGGTEVSEATGGSGGSEIFTGSEVFEGSEVSENPVSDEFNINEFKANLTKAYAGMGNVIERDPSTVFDEKFRDSEFWLHVDVLQDDGVNVRTTINYLVRVIGGTYYGFFFHMPAKEAAEGLTPSMWAIVATMEAAQ